MRKIQVFNRQQAIELAPDPETVVISITDPGDIAPLRTGWGSILRLQFHDAVEEDELRGLEELTMFDDAHVSQIVEFIEKNRDRQSFMVHCAAGISRSVAVGMFIRDCIGGELRLHAAPSETYANGRILRLLHRTLWFTREEEEEARGNPYLL